MYRHNQLYIHIYLQKHIQHNNDERTQFFRKIYLSLYLKGLCVRGELETEQRLQHIDPHFSGYTSISFPFSWAAQLGAWGPSLCWDRVLIPASSLQLIWTFCHQGYIIIWCPPTSCERHVCTQFNLSTVKVIPWTPDIIARMHLLFTPVHFFFWQLGQGQYAT